jgi:hypothetical protein
MHGTGRMLLLALVFAAAVLGVWLRFSALDANSTVPTVVKASITPIDIMEKVGKDLRDETPREPF